jgi:hypothetical protein
LSVGKRMNLAFSWAGTPASESDRSPITLAKGGFKRVMGVIEI